MCFVAFALVFHTFAYKHVKTLGKMTQHIQHRYFSV